MLWPNPLEWFSFTMFVVSVPLYILFIVTIVKFRNKKPFNTSFFTLCVALGVGDIGNLCNQWFLFKFEQFDWFGLGQFALNNVVIAYIADMLSWEFAIMQHIAVTCLALNRFVSLVTPQYYETFWTKRVTTLVIVLEFVLPLPVVVPHAWLDFGYVVDNDTGSVGVPVWLSHDAQKIYYIGFLVFNGVMNGLTLAMYCVIFYSIHRHYKKAANQRRARNAAANQERPDVKLAVFGLCVFGVMFMYGVYSFLMAIQPAGDIAAYRFNLLLWQTISDIFSWCNPWLIIICSKKVRKHMFAVACCRPAPNQVVPIPTPKQARSKQIVPKRNSLVAVVSPV